jgi:hypothetical protein
MFKWSISKAPMRCWSNSNDIAGGVEISLKGLFQFQYLALNFISLRISIVAISYFQKKNSMPSVNAEQREKQKLGMTLPNYWKGHGISFDADKLHNAVVIHIRRKFGRNDGNSRFIF